MNVGDSDMLIYWNIKSLYLVTFSTEKYDNLSSVDHFYSLLISRYTVQFEFIVSFFKRKVLSCFPQSFLPTQAQNTYK